MSCLAYMGQAVFAGATRNKTLPDFISCFARHVGECERTGRNGSTANYRMAYRMLVRYVGGGKLPPEQFTAEWLERYERWLLTRGLGTNSVVFHMRSLRVVYNRAVEQGLFPAAGSNPFRRRLIKQVATRKRALPQRTDNLFLLYAQNPEIRQVKTFEKWKEEGKVVKTGSKGYNFIVGQEYEKDGVIQQGYSIQKAYDISQIRTKQPEEAEPKPMDQLMEALLTDSEVRIQIADHLPDKVQAQYIPNKRTIYVRNGMSENATFHSISRELACASLDHHDGSYSRAGVSAQAYCAAYVTAQKYGVDVSGFSFDKVCQMQAFGQKDPKELRSFIQDVKSAAYSIGKQVDRNLGKSEQEFMTDEFAIPEEKTEKPAKSKKSPER